MRQRARVDLNQREIVSALERLGWKWVDLTRCGGGVPDGAVSRGGVVRFVEVKGPKGKLTPDQERFHALHPVVILRSVDDAIQLR